MTEEIRQTATVDGRTLHLRRSGSGPAVVLMHESPRSSAVLVPLAQHLARRFTVFALDTPGFGESDPLPFARPTVQDFADAVVASMRALGVARAAVYGTHTGACIAMSVLRRHPDFATGAVLDGYPVFTAAESDQYAHNYLKLFEPSWDGRHVPQLWSRVRDQYTFFPWYDPGRASRLPRDPPPPEMQTAVVRDLLAAGNSYAVGYEAAFRMDALAEVEGVTAPVCFLCREDDLLFSHLDRLPPLPANMEIVRLGPSRQRLAERIAEAMTRMPGTVPPPPVYGPEGSGRGVLRALTPGLLARCYSTGAEETLPLVLLHDLPGGVHEWDALAQREATRRRVFALHLPGAGVSPSLPGDAADPEAVVGAVIEALASHGVDRFDVGGCGAGALLALRCAVRPAVGRVLLVDPPAMDQGEALAGDPLLTPDWHGGHLLAAWFETRDRMLYRPWHRRRSANARPFGPGVDIAAAAATFRARVLSQGQDVALARRVLADAPSLGVGGPLSRATAILRQGDPDVEPLRAALVRGGARVELARYDDLPDAAASALRSR